MSGTEAKETYDDEKKPEPSTMTQISTKTQILAMGMESLVKVAKLVDTMLPTILHLYSIANTYYVKYKEQWSSVVPSEVNTVLLGLCLCLYGGNFPALIATVTAIHQTGQGYKLKKAVIDIYEQVMKASKIIEEDEVIKQLDKNDDGKVSLEEIAAALQEQGKGLLMTVMPMVMTRVDPHVINDAIASVWAIWCSVLITLQSVFAQQISMGMQVGEIISGTAKHHISPIVAKNLDKSYKVWADYGVTIGCKMCGVLVAMFLAKLIGGFMSAMQGGEIIAKVAITTAKEYQVVITNETENLQSMLTYIFGGLGFYYQLTSGFSINVFLQLLFLPASIAEMVLGFFVYRA